MCAYMYPGIFFFNMYPGILANPVNRHVYWHAHSECTTQTNPRLPALMSGHTSSRVSASMSAHTSSKVVCTPVCMPGVSLVRGKAGASPSIRSSADTAFFNVDIFWIFPGYLWIFLQIFLGCLWILLNISSMFVHIFRDFSDICGYF